MGERPDATGLWPSLRRPATADRIAEQIVGHIDAQRLRSGDKLPSERELAGLLGVSRPSLREALRSLQERGLIRVRHGSGAFVAEPAAGAALRQRLAEQEVGLRELFDMREVIELPAADWAARRQDPERLAAVRAAFEELDAAAGADEVDYARLQELDAAFHLRIVEAAGNRFLSQTLGVLHEILATGMRTTLTIPGRLQRSRRDHERILAAILAGDAAGARRAAKQHVTGARRAALGRLADEQGAAEAVRAGR